MKTFRRTTGVLFAAALCAGPASGQDVGRPRVSTSPYVDAEGGLGLTDAVARALEREPGLRAARTDIDVALGQRQQAGLRPNPAVTVERREQTSGPDYQTRFGVQWPLDLFRRAGRINAAERGIDAARFSVDDRQRLLVADVRLQYGAAAAAVRDVLVADELVTAARRQADQVGARVEQGATPPLDRDLLEVDVRRIEAEQLVAIGRADVALVQLRRLLGMSPDEPLALRETIEILVTGGWAASIVSRPADSASNRADVRESAARVAVAEAMIDQARREGRFDISLFGMYMRMDAGVPPQRITNVGGGAMVMVPLFNRNQGQAAAAQAELSGAEARHEAVMLSADAEVAAARALDAQASRTADLYRSGIRDLARRNLDVVRQTFDLGRATVFDVLAEQRRYLDIEREYTTALREAWDARVSLSRALGDTP